MFGFLRLDENNVWRLGGPQKDLRLSLNLQTRFVFGLGFDFLGWHRCCSIVKLFSDHHKIQEAKAKKGLTERACTHANTHAHAHTLHLLKPLFVITGRFSVQIKLSYHVFLPLRFIFSPLTHFQLDDLISRFFFVMSEIKWRSQLWERIYLV